MKFDARTVDDYKQELKESYGEVYDLLESETLTSDYRIEIDKIKLDGKIARLLSAISYIKKMR